MLLTRRNLFRACGVAGAATLLPGTAAAEPDGWFGWLRANRRHVAAVLDDGRGGRVVHRPHERQPLASVRHVEHLAAYAASGLGPRERVRVADWEQYFLGLDGGAHQAALRALGIASTNGVTADEPQRFVTVEQLVSVVVRHGDYAAGDWLRQRLGVAVPAFSTEVLRLVLGRAVEVERYLGDPRLRLEVLGRFPDVPKAYEGRRSWARGTWAGTAAEVHRALTGASLDDPVVGSLPGVVAVGVGVRREDGRVGGAVVLTREVDEAWSARAEELAGLVRTALVEPAVLREFQVSLS
ncbi:hypothetical protein AB0G02_03975 [Actinosynnema sp. NPDC023658]|uniref:hypothetical protein n=1 Tax=Actinosynnema sp. NPDC023658 TaxID=3155465 RepID=UPI0033C0AAFC